MSDQIKESIFIDFNDAVYNFSTSNVDVDYIQIYIPITFPENLTKQNSVFHLLLNPNYSYNDFVYTFSLLDANNLPYSILDKIYCGFSKDIYITDISGTNVLNFSVYDISMFHKLLEYRNTLNTNLDDIDYDSLDSSLSKLIYKYLQFLTSSNYSVMDEIISLDDTSTLFLFTKYCFLDNIHSIYKKLTINIGDYSPIYYYVYKFKSAQNIPAGDPIVIENVVKPEDNVYVYLNGKSIQEDQFEYNYSSGKLTLYLVNYNLKMNDVIIIKYYSKTYNRIIPYIDSLAFDEFYTFIRGDMRI